MAKKKEAPAGNATPAKAEAPKKAAPKKKVETPKAPEQVVEKVEETVVETPKEETVVEPQKEVEAPKEGDGEKKEGSDKPQDKAPSMTVIPPSEEDEDEGEELEEDKVPVYPEDGNARVLANLKRNDQYEELYIGKLGGLFTADSVDADIIKKTKLYKNPFYKK